MCSQRPCSSPSWAAIWRISTSRWESLRKLQAWAASRYQAMTCVSVRVRCPSIERSAMSGVYRGRPSSPARYRPRFLRGSLATTSRGDPLSRRGTGAFLPGLTSALHGLRPADGRGPGVATGHAHMTGPNRSAGDDRAGPRPADLAPEQLEDLPERALV